MSDGIPSPKTPCKCTQLLLPLSSEPLLHAPSHRPQVAVHLARVLPQDQADNSLSCDCNVLEAAEDVDLGIGQYNSRPCGVFNGEFRLAVLASYATDCATHVLAAECLDVLDFWGGVSRG
jgi:hypothetical protein